MSSLPTGQLTSKWPLRHYRYRQSQYSVQAVLDANGVGVILVLADANKVLGTGVEFEQPSPAIGG